MASFGYVVCEAATDVAAAVGVVLFYVVAQVTDLVFPHCVAFAPSGFVGAPVAPVVMIFEPADVVAEFVAAAR